MRITIKQGIRVAEFDMVDYPEPRLLTPEQRKLVRITGSNQSTLLAEEFNKAYNLGFTSCYETQAVKIDRKGTIKYREQKASLKGEQLSQAAAIALFARHGFYIEKHEAANVVLAAQTADVMADKPTTNEPVTDTLKEIASTISVAVLTQVHRNSSAPMPWLNHNANDSITNIHKHLNWLGRIPTPDTLTAMAMLSYGDSKESDERTHQLLYYKPAQEVDRFIKTILSKPKFRTLTAKNLWSIISACDDLSEAEKWLNTLPADMLETILAD